MKRHWINLICCCLWALPCVAQNSSIITVQVIDGKTGKPMSDRDIWVDKINPNTLRPIVKKGLPLKGTTDTNGKVYFSTVHLQSTDSGSSFNESETQVPSRKTLSKRLDVGITYASGGIQCSTGLFSLNEILTYGAVGDNRCDKKFHPSKFNVVPGEVLIFVGKYHWWQAGQT